MVNASPEKVATPLTAVVVRVPRRVSPPGLLDSATVTVPLKEVMTLPEVSSAVTVSRMRSLRSSSMAAEKSLPGLSRMQTESRHRSSRRRRTRDCRRFDATKGLAGTEKTVTAWVL